MKKPYLFLLIFSLVCLTFILAPKLTFSANQSVYVIPVEDTVERGLSAFLNRSINEAEDNGADLIVLELNTPGGAVSAASDIGKIISSAKVPTVAFVNKEALSAGAYIALNANQIYMAPGSTMGAAAIIDQAGNTADKKAQSYWDATMQAAAEQNGRNPIYALAMADESVDLPQYDAEKGKLLTLTAEQAMKVKYAEGIVKNRAELLSKLGFKDASVTVVNETVAEKIARFLTNPFVIPILLTIGSLGLIIELFTPGFGLAGFTGITALFLFFFGHLVAGLAGIESVILFVIGVILIIAELFLPGAIAGILGIVAVIASLFVASGDVVQMGYSILIALIISIIVLLFILKVLGKKIKLFNKIILSDSTSTENGYVSNVNRLELIGEVGFALTTLRPSGTGVFNDERVDVVTEGGYIDKDKRIKVIKVEGSRIVVREII